MIEKIGDVLVVWVDGNLAPVDRRDDAVFAKVIHPDGRIEFAVVPGPNRAALTR